MISFEVSKGPGSWMYSLKRHLDGVVKWGGGDASERFQ